ncbi:MAG TPA: hypothetical protein VG897_14365 [Terriglobales bacterium]|nr:hypothetical protein [Terriglobales bacterium]
MLRGSLITAILLIASLAFADTTQRLVLKDGSYQRIQKYEIKDDRVRYYSAERYQWEEIPNSMIDWDATKKFNDSLANQAAEEEAKRKAEEEAQIKNQAETETDARTPEVAANLKLPDKSGVFALDPKSAGPQLMELAEHKTDNVQHSTKFKLLKKYDPLVNRSETLELPQARSSVQIHSARPVFFIRPELEDEEGQRKKAAKLESGDAYQYEILKADRKDKSRLVATIKTNAAEETSVDKTEVPVYAQLMPGDLWIKLEPKKDLSPGEYVILKTLPGTQLSSYVWDFGIDTGAQEASRKSKPKNNR